MAWKVASLVDKDNWFHLDVTNFTRIHSNSPGCNLFPPISSWFSRVYLASGRIDALQSGWFPHEFSVDKILYHVLGHFCILYFISVYFVSVLSFPPTIWNSNPLTLSCFSSLSPQLRSACSVLSAHHHESAPQFWNITQRPKTSSGIFLVGTNRLYMSMLFIRPCSRVKILLL